MMHDIPCRGSAKTHEHQQIWSNVVHTFSCSSHFHYVIVVPRLYSNIIDILLTTLFSAAFYAHFLVMVRWFLKNLSQTIKPFDIETCELKPVQTEIVWTCE